MRKKRQEKIYTKTFNVQNKEGKFTEDDFKLFIEKLEIIRKLYYDENIHHDHYSSFRNIISEIKRAAHNAGLKAKLLNLDYKSNNKYTTIFNNSEPVIVNLCVSIKTAAKFGDENNFVITDIRATRKPILIISGMSCKIDIDDYMKDEDDISYHYMEVQVYDTEYIH